MLLTLVVSKLHWIKDPAGDACDLCAHGEVDLQVDGVPIAGLAAYECTVGAAALYLLRSLSEPHRSDTDAPLFPCCGFGMFEGDEPDSVVIIGCPNGAILDVRHERDDVIISTPDGDAHRVSSTQWRELVFSFADTISAFYRSASPEQPMDEDRAGFRSFLREWHVRRGEPLLSPAEEARLRSVAAG